jgi:TPR repeat protein
VALDRTEARLWLEKAAAHGNRGAQRLLTDL